MLPSIRTPLPVDMNPRGGGKLFSQVFAGFRLFLHFAYILISLFIGMLLLYLPWLRSWENNYLLYLYPQFRPLVANAFFKGFVLGLGIANILIGIYEVAQLGHSRKGKHLSL
jgi:hypothetical protein